MAETKINANQTNITASDIGGLTNNTSNSGSLSINGTISGTGARNTAIQGAITSSNAECSVAIGNTASARSHYSVAVGTDAFADYYSTAIGKGSNAGGTNGIAIGAETSANAQNAIQLGSLYRSRATNSDANTFKVANANGNFEIMSADGTIPAARIPYVPKTITSSSASGYAANTIVQYVGTTDATCTNGYFYKAGIVPSSATISQTTGSGLTDIAVVTSTFESQISTPGSYNFTYVDGAGWTNPDNYFITLADYGISYTGTPADGDVLTVVYVGESNSWTRVDVQPAGSSLPSQTGNAGKFLTTDGTDASWATISALQNTATQPLSSLAIEGNAYNTWDVAIGKNSAAYKTLCVAVGPSAASYSVGGIAIGGSSGTFNENASYFIAIGYQAAIGANAKGAIQIGKGTNSTAGTMSVGLTTDGTTWNNYELLSADGTIPTARLTKVNSTITLTAAGWSSNTQTVNVTGMTTTGVVLVSPDPTDQADYTSAGILCTAQAAGTLTFTCDTVPSADIDVNVVML